MKFLRVSGFTALLLLPTFAAAGDVWTKNDGYLKSAINDCSAAAGADRTSCRNFTGEALARLFGIGDFCTDSRCMNVPIGVGARVDRPGASIYGKGLNWLFADPAKVVIYVRL